MKSNLNLGLLILRLSIGILLLLHGVSKLQFGIDWMVQMLEAKGIPGFIAYGSIIGEVLAPLMIIFGFRTKIGALIIAFNMATAIFLVHSADIFTLSDKGGLTIELPALFMLGALALVFSGAGKFAASTSSKFD